jgi:Peptidase family M50
VAVLIAVVHLIIVIHELGHLAGGRLAGLQFRILIVGLLRIERSGGRTRIGLNRELAHYGGLAGSSPAGDSATAAQLAIVSAAGPVASLLFGGLAVVAAQAGVADGFAVSADLARFVAGRSLAVFGAGSITVGLANLVPMQMGANRSDGARLVALWRNGAAEAG